MEYPQPIRHAKRLYCYVLNDLFLGRDIVRVKYIIDTVFHNAAMKYLVIKYGCDINPVEQAWATELASLSNLHIGVLQTQVPQLSLQSSGGFKLQRPQRVNRNIFTTDNIGGLTYGDPPVQAPPNTVMEFFENFGDEWLAFDIETHDLIPTAYNGGTGRDQAQGQFGHQCGIDSSMMKSMRIIQLGWCFGNITANTSSTKTRLVLQDGVVISDSAIAKHHITNACIRNKGVPVKVVLHEFLQDVLDIVGRGGRICAHQIEFDAGVIGLEMERHGFGTKSELWSQAACCGFCTMNPSVSKWSCDLFFDHRHGNKSVLGRSSPVGLTDMVMAIIPHEFPKIARHHDAGIDAELTWELVRELSHRTNMFRNHV